MLSITLVTLALFTSYVSGFGPLRALKSYHGGCITESEALQKCISEETQDCVLCSHRALKENGGIFPDNDLGAAIRCDIIKKGELCDDLLDCAYDECPDDCLKELHDHASCIVKMESGCHLDCSVGSKANVGLVVITGAAFVGLLGIV